ncbi:MAG: hypothetical protein H6845_01610 [Alphaproteobacteria bacterium]|nr:MAG: hypothetical protein H6845_01610 [Alphaproteobacteria bacterium]
MLTKIAVLYGGWSEYEASIKSKNHIISLINKYKHDNTLFSNNIDILELNPADGLTSLRSKLLEYQPELVVNLVHGYWGEDGYAQLFLDELKFPYTGPKHHDAFLSINKHVMKEICHEIGVPVMKGGAVELNTYLQQADHYPHIVKSIYGGSSHGIEVIHTEQEKLNYKNNSTFLYEHFNKGVEVTHAVKNGKYIGGLIIKHPGEIYDTNSKKTGQGVEFLHLDTFPNQNLIEKSKKYAIDLYNKINGRGVARLDFTVSDECYFMDYNAIPGTVLLPVIMKMRGYTELDFLKLLLTDATFS